MLGKIEGRRRRGRKRMRRFNVVTNSVDMNVSKLQEIVKGMEAWLAAAHGGARFSSWVWKIPCRKACPPIPVFLPGESHGQGSLACYGPQGGKESDTPEAT